MGGTVTAAISPNVVLTVVNPSGQATRVWLMRMPFTIGRQAGNDLVLRDNRVSRNHARIVRDGDEFAVEDLDSRHGTFVNGKRITGRQRLESGDRIDFGFEDGYHFTFTREERGVNRLASQVASTSLAAQESGTELAKLRALVEVARTLRHSLSLEEVLDSVVDAALAVTGAQRGFLLLKKEGQAALRIEVARDASGQRLPEAEWDVPMKVIQEALQSRRDLLSVEFQAASDSTTAPEASATRLGLRSVVCVPLVRIKPESTTETVMGTAGETVGLIYLDSREDMADLSGASRGLLQTLALEASTVLENARLLEEERARERLEQELEIARTIQQGLLPRQPPRAGWFRMVGSSLASEQVGGDYFDVIRVGEDCWALVVADVSGKGVSSALLAALLQGAFFAGAGTAAEIEALLKRLNRFLYERTEGERYATLFYAAVHRDGAMAWSNAGHCAPLLVGPDGAIESLRPTSMPVGMLEDTRFEVRERRLASGARLVIYSDGVSEAVNPDNQYFDRARIRAVLDAHPQAGAEELFEALSRAVRDFVGDVSQRDDMTLVVAEYVAEGQC